MLMFSRKERYYGKSNYAGIDMFFCLNFFNGR